MIRQGRGLFAEGVGVGMIVAVIRVCVALGEGVLTSRVGVWVGASLVGEGSDHVSVGNRLGVPEGEEVARQATRLKIISM